MSSFKKLFASAKNRSKVSSKTRLGILSLEGRDMPSVTLLNETLSVTGSTGNDNIEIFSPQANQTIVKVNGIEQFNGADSIQKVIIDGRAGNDSLAIHGLQADIVNGANVSNVETVIVGDQNGAGLSSTANVRSNLFVQNPNFLLVNNSASTDNQQIAVSATAVTGDSPARIGFTFNNSLGNLIVQAGSGNDNFTMNSSQVGSTILNGQAGIDTFNINGTNGQVRINGGEGADNINIAPVSQSLADIHGRVNLSDGQFQDKVSIDDRKSGATADSLSNYSAVMTQGELNRTETKNFHAGVRHFQSTDAADILYLGVGEVRFNATNTASSGSSIVLTGSNPQTSTTIDAGLTSKVALGGPGHILDSIDGPVQVLGGRFDTQLVFDDTGSTVSERYNLGADSLKRIGMGTVNFGDYLGLVSVNGGNKSDVFSVTSPRGFGRGYALNGNGGNDILIAPNQNNVWSIQGQNVGTLDGTVSFFNMDSLDGQAGADTFVLSNGAGVSGRIDGGGGFDTLDYSSYATPVGVNLSSGFATNIKGGENRIKNVLGGAADDVLIGNALDNVLSGNAGEDFINGGVGGRDLLVGGAGADNLSTNGVDDTLYVGGDLSPADRNNLSSLQSLMQEWTGSGSYDSRSNNILNGTGATNGVRLNANVLDSDLASDSIIAGTGRDMFFADTVDSFSAPNLPQANEKLILV